jgi:hypothetical protein
MGRLQSTAQFSLYSTVNDVKNTKKVLTKMNKLYAKAGMTKEALEVSLKIVQLATIIKPIL